jgi:hypothetical protein|tara:strand:- start:1113 stop:1286 length:174 start_codon:yes stop_codon:yes gene_type:complete
MPRPKSNKERYNFLIDKETYEDFSLICDEEGLVRSKKVEKFMKEFIERNQEVLKKSK